MSIVSMGQSAAMINADQFRWGMRHMAGAVSVIATGRVGQRAGLTATAVCSVSAEPPRLLVCVNTSASAHDMLKREGVLSVNVLRPSQLQVASAFASSRIKGEDRFACGDWSEMDGVPVLGDASVAFSCRIAQRICSGTHTIFLCDVVDCISADDEDTKAEGNLLYFGGAYGRIQPLTAPAAS